MIKFLMSIRAQTESRCPLQSRSLPRSPQVSHPAPKDRVVPAVDTAAVINYNSKLGL
jgi:hypothetical protein